MRQSQNRKNNSEEEYDITKSMIKSIKNMLTEAVVDGIYEVDPQVVREEELKFVDSVSKRIDFNDLKVYVTGNGNVEWSGVILQYGIEWKYSLESSTGVYMSSNLLQLTDDTLTVISKLSAYYDIWAAEWSDKLAEIVNKEGVEEVKSEEGDL